MGLLKSIITELKFWEDCRNYGLSVWQCPKFLFIVMGFVTISAMIATYFIADRYTEPEFVVASVSAVAMLIFIIGNMVVASFEKMASASRMKTEFVSIVSHQLRTPLSSIKWALEFIVSGRAGELKEKQLEYTKIMWDNNERVIKLVNDLLNVTRIEEGRMAAKKEEFDIGEEAEKIISAVSSFAEASNVVVELKNNLNGLKILADKQYVSVALSNLIDNAIRYIHGKGNVAVVLKRKGSFVRVEVKDNGVGIPKSEQRNIFKKFFRSQNIMRHRTEGSGLGLYIAKAFVALHGGKIGFSSEEGNGTTFWFEIPIKS